MPEALNALGVLAIGTRLRVVSENMMAIVKDYYTAHDLAFEPRWFPLFRTVRERPGIGMMALSQGLGVSHAAINIFCKQLSEEGLITLSPDPLDARIKQVKITPKGDVLYTRLEPAWFVLEKALVTAIPDAEAIMTTLSQLEDAIEDQAIPRALKATLKNVGILNELEIVPYDPGDPAHKASFAALNIEWLEHYFTVEPTDWTMFSDPYGTIIAPGGAIYMAKVDGQIVGTCSLIKRGARYELAKMAVSNLFQGKGIGTRLIGAIEDAARRMGLEKLYLVSSTILPHAVPAYRKLGYTDCTEPLHDLYARSDITLEKHLAD